MKSTRKLVGSAGFPSKGLLRYLQRAINPQVHTLPYCQRRLRACREYGHVPWMTEKENGKEGLNRGAFEALAVDEEFDRRAGLRNESLDFLVHGSVRGLESPLDEFELTAPAVESGETSGSLAVTVEPKCIITATDPTVIEWSRECWKACINHDWQSVASLLEAAAEQCYTPYETNLKYILNQTVQHKQHHLALSLFQKFELILQHDKKSICQAIEAAFKLKKYILCEQIFSKYMDLAMHDSRTQVTMLKCFITNYDLTLAKAFLEQIWGSVTSEHIDAYIIGIIFVARNVAELRQILKKWTDACNGVVGPQTLALSMTGFLHLRDDEALVSAFQTAQDLGIFDHYLIQKVLLEKALLLRDDELFSKTVNHMRLKDIEMSQGPFRRAIVYFSKKRDISGVKFCVSKMYDQGFNMDGKVFNILLVAAVRTDPAFDIVRYLDGGLRANIARNESTVEYVRRALIAKYSRKGDVINQLFVRGLKEWTSNQWVQQRIAAMKVDKIPGARRFVPVPLNEVGSVDALRQLQADVAKKKLETGLKKVEELIRQGIMPGRAIFVNAISAFLRQKRLADVDVLLHKFTECGHEIDSDIEFLALQRDIIQGTALNISDERYAMSLTRSFLSRYPSLALKKRIALAYMLFDLRDYDTAAGLFDSLRAGGKVGSLNHSSESLAGLITCFRAKDDIVAAVGLLRDILNGDRDIELDTPFFAAIRACQRQAEKSGNDSLVDEIVKLESQCEALQAEYWESAAQTVEEALQILKKWEAGAEELATDIDKLELLEQDLDMSLTTAT